MEKKDRLGFSTKLCFGMGEIPGVTVYSVMGILLMFFFTDVVGILPAIAGAIFMVGRAWDAVTDPLIGMISDRTRSRWGRRRPFLLLSAIPLTIAFIMLWYPYPLEAQWSKAIVYTLIFMMFMTFFTTYYVPYLALMSELTDDYSERTVINNYRVFFTFLFGLAASVLPKMIADSYEDPKTGFMMAGLFVSLFILVFPFVVFKGVKERYQDFKPPEKIRFFYEFKMMMKNRSFRYLIFIFVGASAAIMTLEGFVLYYMKYWIGREKEMPILFVSVVLASVLTLPFWSYLSGKFGKKATITWALLFWGLSQLLWLFLKPTTPSSMVYLAGVVVGIGFGCAHVLPWAMFPDVVDQDELQTGQRREGVYSGIMTLLMKGSNSIATLLIGVILQATGYVANQAQSETVLDAMRYIMSFGPLIFILIGLVASLYFPITKERYDEIRRELEEKRAEEKIALA